MENGSEVCPSGTGEQAGDVFEYGELGIFSMSGTPRLLNYANGFKEETASFALVKPRLFTSNADVLARTSECQHIRRRNLIAANLRDIPQMLHLRETAGGHGDGVGFYFAGEHRHDAVLCPSQLKGAAAGKQRSQRHHAGTSRSSNTTGIFALASFYRSSISSRISGYTPLPRRREKMCRHSRIFAFMTMCVAVELGRIFRASSGFSPFSSRK